MKIQDLDTPAVCAGAVTSSTQTFQPPANILNYSSGTNGRHEPEKTRTAAYCRMLVERWAAFDPALKEYDVRLFLVMLTLLQPDGLIIAGEPKLCRLTMKKSLRTPRQALERLCKAGYLTCVRKGNGKGNASHYVRGEMFNPERSKELQTRIRELTQRGTKNTPFDGERVQFFGSKGGQKIHPQPIDQPIHTHTEELPSAFNKENWMAHTENQTLFPKWTREDRERSFELAKAKGYETDKTWRGCCAFWFNQWQKHNAKPQAPAAAIARKAFSTSTRPAYRSQCESAPSWKTPGREKFKDEWEWEDAGCPKDWATWLKWGCPLRKGLPAPHTLTRRIEALLIETWNKGQTLTLEDAQKELGTIDESSFEIGEARAKHQMKQKNALQIA